MYDIQAFTSPVFGKIRAYIENGYPFFCLSDICRVLGIKNSSDAKTRLNPKGVVTTDTLTNGGMQHITFIDESNLYKLIFQSRKSEAEQFTDWVTGEVLPAIRKHGLYAVDDLLNNPDLAIKAFEALKQERKARIDAERKNALLMHVSKTYTATEIAKELGFRSAIELNNELEWMLKTHSFPPWMAGELIRSDVSAQPKLAANTLTRRSMYWRTWVPKADYADKGYFIIKQEALDNGKVVYTRRITQEGRTFLLDLFDCKPAA